MRHVAAVMSLALVTALGSGCVEKSKYDALEVRFKERDAAFATAQKDATDARRAAAQSAEEKAAVEKEVALLRARLEGREIEASLKDRADTTVAAGAGHACIDEDEVATIPSTGLPVNPATGGIVIDGGVLFAPGSATIRTQGEPVLAKVLEAITAEGAQDARVRIDGHTDDQPIQKSKFRDNWELSGERARAVLLWFEGHGVASDRLSFAGFGASRPLATSGKAARAQNRRVEVVLVRGR